MARIELRDYQRAACNAAVVELFRKGVKRTLIILPTGCGKTVVFNFFARYIAYKGSPYDEPTEPSGRRVLILAHQNNLIEQADDKIRMLFGFGAAREKGADTCNEDDPITVSTVQTMSRRLKKFGHDFFDLIIIDEAHHAMSEQYQHVIDHFSGAKVLGVTATPDRADGLKLECFESVAYEYTIEQAQKDGYLAPITVEEMTVDIDLNTVKKMAGDIDEKGFAELLEPCLEKIIRKIEPVIKGRKTVCFVPLIKTARRAEQIISERFGCHEDLAAISVCGADKDRNERLEAFANGEYNIIFNAMLLTEGWDCPDVDCVIILRPTTSRALYTQMIGRGLRLAPDKTDCLVVDFLFQNSKFDLASPKNVLGKNEPKEPGKSMEEDDEEEKDQEEMERLDANARLIQKLAEAKAYEERLAKVAKRKKKDRLPVALELWPDLADIDDPRPMTKAQEDNLIDRWGIDPRGLSVRGAVIATERANVPSSNQKYRLRRLGYSAEEIDRMTAIEAGKVIGKAKAMGRW